jgi:hypothetical protein
MFQDPDRVQAPTTVVEGGTITIRTSAEVDHVIVLIAGRSSTRIPVVNGRAEYPLPPNVTGGTVVSITDGRIPNPSSTDVLVVGGQGS